MSKEPYPKRWVFYDTETKTTRPEGPDGPQVLELWLGVAKSRDSEGYGDDATRELKFTTADQFHDWVQARGPGKDPLYIFAHNHGFDARIVGLFQRIADGEYSLQPKTRKVKMGSPSSMCCIIESPPMIVKTWTNKGMEIIWCDTFQWVSQSLASIGDQLGFPKGKMPRPDDPLDQWWEYCERDVDVLIAAIEHVWEWLLSLGVERWMPTRAGQSMQIFSQLYKGKDVQTPLAEQPSNLARQGYYGGYTQCFKQGHIEGPVYQLDVNSLYPHVMEKFPYPYKLKEHVTGHRVMGPSVVKCPASSIAEVFLETGDEEYPYRCRDGTYWVRGRVRTVLCGPELERAYVCGHVKGVGSYSRYDLSYLFADFVKDFHGMKVDAEEEGRMMDRLIIKLMMNSLYGKYGQKEYKWFSLGHHDDPAEFTRGQVVGPDGAYGGEILILGGEVFISKGIDDAKCAYPPIAAFTTAYARELMRGVRATVGDGHYFYQATDSLHVDGHGMEEIGEMGLLHQFELGKFKQEAIYESVRYNNIHNYDTNTKKVRGSLRKSAVPLGGETYRTERWESLRTGINSGHLTSVVIEPFVKRLSSEVTRRKKGADGWCQPHKVNTWRYTIGELQSSHPKLLD